MRLWARRLAGVGLVVGLLVASAAAGVMVCFGLDVAEGRVAAAVLGLWVGLMVVVRWLTARRPGYPRTLVYDPEARAWVAVVRRGPRIKR